MEKFLILTYDLKSLVTPVTLFHIKDYASYKKKLASFQLFSANFYGLP